MPVAQGGPPPARQAALVGAGALLGLLAVVFLVSRFDSLGGGQQGQVDLDTPSLTLGQATDLADVVAAEGPFLFPGPTGSGRDLWLQHAGDDPTEGWTAFAVQAPDADRGCVTEWQAGDRTFVDSCDGTIYPADGDGLPQYPVNISGEGDLTILLDPLPLD